MRSSEFTHVSCHRYRHGNIIILKKLCDIGNKSSNREPIFFFFSLLFLAILLFRFPFMSESSYCRIPFFFISQCCDCISFVLYVMVQRPNLLFLGV